MKIFEIFENSTNWYEKGIANIGLIEITLWYRQDPNTNHLKYNHLEMGHSNKNEPDGKHIQNAKWQKKLWYAKMVGKVPEVVPELSKN